jgi:hypothetical protein
MGQPHIQYALNIGMTMDYNARMSHLALPSTPKAISFSLGRGMGKSGLLLNHAIKAIAQGKQAPYFVWDDGVQFPPERQISLPHDPTHTPLQCLVEGIRRVTEKVGQHKTGLIFSAYVLGEMDIACSVRQTPGKPHRPSIPQSKPQPRWNRVLVDQHAHRFILETSLGCADDQANYASSLSALLMKIGIQGRQVEKTLQRVCASEIEKEGRRLLDGGLPNWWRRPHLLEEAREELMLAWMQGQTSKSERRTSRRL